MRNLLPLIFVLGFIVGCATETREVRKEEVRFEASTPAGPISGRILSQGTTESQSNTKPDIPAAAETASGFLGMIPPTGPVGIAAGLLGLGIAWVAARGKKKAEEGMKTAEETVTAVSAGVEEFIGNSPAETRDALYASLSSKMDKEHKILVRKLKP